MSWGLKDMWHLNFPPFRSETQRMVEYQGLWLSHYALNPVMTSFQTWEEFCGYWVSDLLNHPIAPNKFLMWN